MAIDIGTDNVVLDKKDRSWRIEIFIADDDTVKLVFHREMAYFLNGVLQHRRQLGQVDRTQSQIATKSYTAGGVTRTGNQILALINKMSDVERQYDIDNPHTTPPTP